MATAFTFEYEVSPEIVADAAVTSLIAQRAGPPTRQMRKVGVRWGLLFLLILGVLVVAILAEFPDWLIHLAAALTVFYALCCGLHLFVLVMYRLTRAKCERAILSAYHKLDSPRIRWDLSDAGFTVESGTTRKEHRWTAVRETFVGRKFWILMLDGPEDLLLPVAALPDGAERFMLDRITQAGGDVRMEEPADATE